MLLRDWRLLSTETSCRVVDAFALLIIHGDFDV